MNVAELHTSDLTSACLKRVELRLAGKQFAETQTAVAKGQLFHELVSAWWAGTATSDRNLEAFDVCARRARDEGQPFSAAVLANRDEIEGEAVRWMGLYEQRFAALRERVSVVGVELPIRYTLDVDGEPQEFASHLDLLYTDGNRTVIRDWKTGEESPHFAFLRRNIQLGLYWLAVREGEVCIDRDLDQWVNIGEWASVEWVHVRALEPYKKACPGINDAGEPVNFKKGDLRPMRNVVKEVTYVPAQAEALKDELRTRVRMVRAGLWPANPDPVGCGLCNSKAFCPAWGVMGGEDGE